MFLSLAAAAVDYSTSYNFDSSASSGGSTGVAIGLIALYVVLIILMLVSTWKVFTKAGRPGWASLIPVYNTWVLFELGGKPGWWSLLLLIPFVNFIAIIMLIVAYVEVSKRFGKGGAFTVLLVLLPFIAFPILAFGKAQYQAPGGDTTPLQDGNGTPETVAPIAPQSFDTPVAPSSPEVVAVPQAPVVPPAPSAPETNPQPPQVITPTQAPSEDPTQPPAAPQQ